jgi:hypothetical protein
LRLGKRRAGQQGIIAVTVAAPIGSEVLLLAKEAAICAATVGTMQPVGMQVLFEPRHAGRIIEQIGDREIDHRFLPVYNGERRCMLLF